MEHPIQPETAIAHARRMQAVTIELCVAYLDNWCHSPVTSKKMKDYVSRVCGLTKKDFERAKDGTEKTKENEKVDINDGINAIVGGGKYGTCSICHNPECREPNTKH